MALARSSCLSFSYREIPARSSRLRFSPLEVPRCSLLKICPRLLTCNASKSDGSSPADEAAAREERRRLRRELVEKLFESMAKNRTEEVDYPMWMDDEGDPNWGDEPDDGWGFRLDKFFKKPKTVSQQEEGESEPEDSEDDVDWDAESNFEWMVREITQVEWHEVIFVDQRPIMVFVYERYGHRWSVCWDALKQLEKAVKTLYDKKGIALRVAKIDAEREPDLANALKLKSLPALLVIRNSKLLHRIYGYITEDEILQAAAHFYYGGGKPEFLQEGTETPEQAPQLTKKTKRSL